jgi:hypothetical protein
MIKAGSLFYAIVISLVIAILTSSILLFGYTVRSSTDRAEMQRRLVLNAGSGIQLLLSAQEIVPQNSSKIIDLYNEGTDSIELSQKTWGAYSVLNSKAFFKKEERSITALCGSQNAERYCIRLADHDKPLAMCGKTVLKGDAFLPAAGVKRAYIEGQSFVGANMVQGIIHNSTKSVPDPPESLLLFLRGILSGKVTDDDSLLLTEGIIEADSLSNDFQQRTMVFYTPGNLHIAGGAYSGNIAFLAGGTITVDPTAQLNDVILGANKICLKEGLRASLQAFAADSILLEKNVSLSYPSVLGAFKRNEAPAAVVILGEKDSVCGTIFAFKEKEVQQSPGVIIRKEAFAEGEILTNGFADMQGTLHGSLSCVSLLLRTPSSVYENHLLNAVIDVIARPGVYSGMLGSGGTNQIVKYLR